jgi:hypothetical protein
VNRLDTKHLFYTDVFGREDGLVGLMLITNPFSYHPLIDGMDRLVLSVQQTVAPERETEHWMWDDSRIQVRRVTPEALECWIVSGENRNVIQWLAQGELLWDPEGFLDKLQGRLTDMTPLLREQKLLFEYSHFIRAYLQSKQDLKDGQVLDAYSNVLSSLQYWAHIALVEAGMHPELTVWEQIRDVNPGIYKLYEELTANSESVEKRAQLVLLACEFTALSKMESSCALLIRLLRSRAEAWTVAELKQHPELAGLSLDLSLLLQKLVSRGSVREVAKSIRERGIHLLELRYIAD